MGGLSNSPTDSQEIQQETPELIKQEVLKSLSKKLELRGDAATFISSLVDKLCNTGGGISFNNENLEDVLKKIPQWKAILELKKDNKLETIMTRLSGLSPEKQVNFVFNYKKGDDLDKALTTFLTKNKETKERNSDLPSESGENAMEIYFSYTSEIEPSGNDKGKIDITQTAQNIKSKAGEVIINLKEKVIVDRQKQAEDKARKKEKTESETKGEKMINQKDFSAEGEQIQEVGDSLKNMFNFTPTLREKLSDQDKLEIAFDLKGDVSEAYELALNAKDNGEATKIIESLQAGINKKIDEYVQTLKGKTKEDLKELMNLDEDAKQAYLDTIPSAYKNTEYAKMYAEYLKDPETPPKGFNEFLNENTEIKPLERLFIMIMGLFKDLKGSFDFSEEGKKKKEDAEKTRDNELRKACGLGTFEEAETVNDIKLKIDNLVKDQNKWDSVKINEFKEDNPERIDFGKVRSHFSKESSDIEFMNEVLNAESTSVLGIARTKGFSMESLKYIDENKDRIKVEGDTLVVSGLEKGSDVIENGETKESIESKIETKTTIDKEKVLIENEVLFNQKLSELAKESDVPVDNLKELLDVKMNVPKGNPNREGALANGLGRIGFLDSGDFRTWLVTSRGQSLLNSEANTMREWLNWQVEEEKSTALADNQ